MNLQTFDFNEAPVRVLLRDEQPWFVAADVCRVLEIVNSRDAVSGLDEDEKATVGNPDSRPGKPGAKSFQVVSESGLYALIFRSRKPEARAFRKWVTAEVLPAIRLTGRYVNGEAPAALLRTVRDDMMQLRGLLLSSASAVQLKMLDVGRAQQVANLAARFLETIKLEGDAIGYETLFEMRAGEGGGGFLPGGSRPPDAGMQGMPQRGVPRTPPGEPGLPGAAAGEQEALGGAESDAGDDAQPAVPGAADLGPEADGCAADVPGAGGPAARAE
ncbi:MAG: Bro-N domain-containing protein [Prosthecobacter sp.]|nr:Bro-N domain-containing protein [Prosthecobacter sp.]